MDRSAVGPPSPRTNGISKLVSAILSTVADACGTGSGAAAAGNGHSINGSAGGNRYGWGAHSWMAGGARPQTAEIIKTLNQRCPEITVTNNLERADFVLTLDHEGGKGALAHRNKVAVFNHDGDDIFSASTRELGNSVKDACHAMLGAKK